MTRAHFDIYAPVGGHGLPDRPRPVAKVEITEATSPSSTPASHAHARRPSSSTAAAKRKSDQTPPAPSPS